MAFTEDQEKAILDSLSKFGEFMAAQSASKETKEQDKTIVQEAKDKVAVEKTNASVAYELQEAIKFNVTIDKFIEDRKGSLPEEAKKIIEAANGKNYDSELARANIIRKGIIESYLEIQANIDALPDTLKTRALRFKALTEIDKENKSSDYWDLVDVGTITSQNIKKAEALKKASGNNNAGDNDAFTDKFLALGNKYKKGE